MNNKFQNLSRWKILRDFVTDTVFYIIHRYIVKRCKRLKKYTYPNRINGSFRTPSTQIHYLQGYTLYPFGYRIWDNSERVTIYIPLKCHFRVTNLEIEKEREKYITYIGIHIYIYTYIERLTDMSLYVLYLYLSMSTYICMCLYTWTNIRHVELVSEQP